MNGKDRRRRPFKMNGRNQDRMTQDFQNNQENKSDARPRNYSSPRGKDFRDETQEGNLRPGTKGSLNSGGPFRKRPGKPGPRYDKNGALYEQPRWIAPKMNTDPMPDLKCSRCGQPITDSHAALTDKNTGDPVHFDCVMAELAEQESLEAGDVLSYIGGGRFGIVHFNNGKGESRNFVIKKIVEWEDKEKRAEWRGVIADHYSIT